MTIGAAREKAVPAKNGRRRTAVLLDQHPLWLEALEQVLSGLGVDVVAKTTQPEAALGLIGDCEPDVFVTSIEMPLAGMDGLECLLRAQERLPQLTTVVVSMYGDPLHVDAARAAGADAYVVKTAEAADIATVIREAVEQPRESDQRSAKPRLKAIRGGPDLTPREFEILQFVAQGHTNAQIAKRLWVTQWTVKFHLANAYRKLGVSNRTEAARYMFERGLAALPLQSLRA